MQVRCDEMFLSRIRRTYSTMPPELNINSWYEDEKAFSLSGQSHKVKNFPQGEVVFFWVGGEWGKWGGGGGE